MTLESQKQNQDRGDISHGGGSHELAMVHMREFQTLAIILDFIVFVGEDRLHVWLFDPPNLLSAYRLAKLQEENLGVTKRTHKPMTYPYLSLENNPLKFPIPNLITRKMPKISLSVQKISQQMKHRRDRGLCYYCDA